MTASRHPAPKGGGVLAWNECIIRNGSNRDITQLVETMMWSNGRHEGCERLAWRSEMWAESCGGSGRSRAQQEDGRERAFTSQGTVQEVQDGEKELRAWMTSRLPVEPGEVGRLLCIHGLAGLIKMFASVAMEAPGCKGIQLIWIVWRFVCCKGL